MAAPAELADRPYHEGERVRDPIESPARENQINLARRELLIEQIIPTEVNLRHSREASPRPRQGRWRGVQPEIGAEWELPFEEAGQVVALPTPEIKDPRTRWHERPQELREAPVGVAGDSRPPEHHGRMINQAADGAQERWSGWEQS